MAPGMWLSLAAYFPNSIKKNDVPVYKHDLSMFITTQQTMECHDQTQGRGFISFGDFAPYFTEIIFVFLQILIF